MHTSILSLKTLSVEAYKLNMHSYAIFTLGFAALVSARTDLSGCTSTTAGASLIYYVPGTGEICKFLDCGGGRAPPKTTVPGCPAYSGTETHSPEFLALATATSNPASATSINEFAVTTPSPITVGMSIVTNQALSSTFSPTGILTDTGVPDFPAITGTPTALVTPTSSAIGAIEADISTKSDGARPSTTTNYPISGAGRLSAVGASLAVAVACMVLLY